MISMQFPQNNALHVTVTETPVNNCYDPKRVEFQGSVCF